MYTRVAPEYAQSYYEQLILHLADPKEQEWLMQRHADILCYKFQNFESLNELMS